MLPAWGTRSSPLAAGDLDVPTASRLMSVSEAGGGPGDMEINEPKVRTSATRLRKFITRLLLVLLLVVLLLIIILVTVYCIAPDVFYAYCIIVDAGSTSTKVTLFRWRDWPSRSNGWIEQVNHTKTSKLLNVLVKNNKASFIFLCLKTYWSEVLVKGFRVLSLLTKIMRAHISSPSDVG
ncbi:unnamed protein product [Schistocephalus solidus]|uniref:Ectonucleoside triphosphate diphosphohydrolase 1 n=1 Tax=Schistocephalus solidus TaxID=70667 RepID=A0A183SW57_SCHSO|nr:unnamed protein product [Schistocephalus solidus]